MRGVYRVPWPLLIMYVILFVPVWLAVIMPIRLTMHLIRRHNYPY